jgi:hypothetical protein
MSRFHCSSRDNNRRSQRISRFHLSPSNKNTFGRDGTFQRWKVKGAAFPNELTSIAIRGASRRLPLTFQRW